MKLTKKLPSENQKFVQSIINVRTLKQSCCNKKINETDLQSSNKQDQKPLLSVNLKKSGPVVIQFKKKQDDKQKCEKKTSAYTGDLKDQEQKIDVKVESPLSNSINMDSHTCSTWPP